MGRGTQPQRRRRGARDSRASRRGGKVRRSRRRPDHESEPRLSPEPRRTRCAAST
jgi:hypothetical protein